MLWKKHNFAGYKYLTRKMDFESLVGRINQVQDVLQAQVAHAVNLSLTARNWLVGYYIVEFEQHGEDRAKYGDKLINRLAKEINHKGFEPRSLRDYRRIYLVYPQLGTEIGSYLQKTVCCCQIQVFHQFGNQCLPNYKCQKTKQMKFGNQRLPNWKTGQHLLTNSSIG